MTRQNHKRGFSLIEAAFVLAVVGAVIGTIWVSAAKFYEDYKVSKTVEGILSTSRNIQNLISFRDAFSLPGITVLTSDIRDAGVFPKDWVDGNTVKNPFGSFVAVNNFTSANTANFRIQFHSQIPKWACIQIITRITSANAMAGSTIVAPTWEDTINARNLNAIWVSPGGWSTSTFPVTPEQAETGCTSANDNSVYIAFGYTRINN